MSLTKKQTTIITLLAQGHTAEQVAEQLRRSVGTVRRHVVLACERVGARNTPNLVAMSVSRGWLNITLSLFLSIVMVADFGGDQLRNAARLRIHRTQQQSRKEA